MAEHKLVHTGERGTPTEFNKGLVIERADLNYGTRKLEIRQKICNKTRFESHIKLLKVYHHFHQWLFSENVRRAHSQAISWKYGLDLGPSDLSP